MFLLNARRLNGQHQVDEIVIFPQSSPKFVKNQMDA